jgi:hypothetical protein
MDINTDQRKTVYRNIKTAVSPEPFIVVERFVEKTAKAKEILG